MFLHSWNYETNYTNSKTGRPVVTLEGWPLSILLKLRSPACFRKAKDFTPDYTLKENLIRKLLAFSVHSSSYKRLQLPQSVKSHTFS